MTESLYETSTPGYINQTSVDEFRERFVDAICVKS